MGRVRCMKMTTAAFDALVTKDGEVLYFVNDTGTFGPDSLETNGRVYLGDKLLSAFSDIVLACGQKVYYNGSDVTQSAALGSIIANATCNWYGTQDAYNELVDNDQVQAGVAYHIEVQADWDETDSSHLGYIKNVPPMLNLSITGSTANFFYVEH